MPEARACSYKFQRLRESIREAIQKGELGEKLPGERELARRFGVNAKTISKALTDLTAEGLLVRQIGRGTFLAGHERGNALLGAKRRYLWLASNVVSEPFLRIMYDSARLCFEARGYAIELERVHVDERGEIPDRCLPVSRLKEFSGLIVFSSTPSRAMLADLTRRHLPVVLCNGASPTLKVNVVVPDYCRGIFDLTEHLIQLGHVQIRLALDHKAVSAFAPSQHGYHAAMSRYGLEPLPLVRCPGEDPSALFALPSPPSAIVCLGGSLAGEIGHLCTATNRSIPEQLSLVAMLAPGQTMLKQHSISTYDVYPEQILDWSMKLLFESAPGVPPRGYCAGCFQSPRIDGAPMRHGRAASSAPGCAVIAGSRRCFRTDLFFGALHTELAHLEHH